MEQERKRRANELETLTKIRTAEGLKQEAVLVSEGQSISLKNLADAEKYAVEIKTLALSNQINTLKEILETNENVVNYLLETKRIEEFGKIASSTNKEIFFVNPKGLIPTSKIIGDTTFNKA
jgi:regulator of protease activity HflC (stomatin/prohibitin superfamily)